MERERNLDWVADWKPKRVLRAELAREREQVKQLEQDYHAACERYEAAALHRRNVFDQLKIARQRALDLEGTIEDRLAVRKDRA